MSETPLHLLLIEDNDDHAQLIVKQLRRAGAHIQVEHAVQLSDGIRKLHACDTFDAVLTDLNLPDSVGINTFRTLSGHANGTPLIALSAAALTSDGTELLREGADDFLPKTSLDSELLFRSVMCAVERKRRSDAQTQLHEHAGQMDMARNIQLSILPHDPPEWPMLDIAVHTDPAQAVGGDYYDFLQLPNGDLLIAIGDATGHGPGAALVMAMAAASLRTLAGIFTDLGEMLRRLNELLVPDTPPFAFMTFCLLRIERETGRLFWANAGHPPPVVMTEDLQQLLTTDDGHVPVGMVSGTYYEERCWGILPEGATLYAVTDGVIEAMSSDGDVYGQRRLDAVVQNSLGGTVDEILQAIQNDLQQWQIDRPADDDETAWVLRWNAEIPIE